VRESRGMSVIDFELKILPNYLIKRCFLLFTHCPRLVLSGRRNGNSNRKLMNNSAAADLADHLFKV
jgi:hypothetical protein